MKRPCSRSFPSGLTGYWALGGKEVERAEKRFEEGLRRMLKRLPKDVEDSAPGVWYAQYAGFFRNGHKVIYVNAISSFVTDHEWRERAIMICDGGLLSFGAVLDLERDAVDSFEFNGTIGGPIRLQEPSRVNAVHNGVAPDDRSPAAPARR